MGDDDEVAGAEVTQSSEGESAGESEAGSAGGGGGAESAGGGGGAESRPRSGVRLALVVGIIAVLGLASVVGWLGYRAYQSHQAQQQRDLFVRVGRQTATYLTTISSTEAQADVQRILDSATGAFYDDFQKRSSSFVEVVQQAQSKSEGTVTEAGLESDTNGQGHVLVAVNVKTQNVGAPDQQPRAWRMRLTVEKVGNDAKVSQVEFIP